MLQAFCMKGAALMGVCGMQYRSSAKHLDMGTCVHSGVASWTENTPRA
jgi:hypothetical protein